MNEIGHYMQKTVNEKSCSGILFWKFRSWLTKYEYIFRKNAAPDSGNARSFEKDILFKEK